MIIAYVIFDVCSLIKELQKDSKSLDKLITDKDSLEMFKTCLYGNGDVMSYMKVEEKIKDMNIVFDNAITFLD